MTTISGWMCGKKRHLELMDYALASAESLDDLPESGMHKDALALKNRHRSYFCCSTGTVLLLP